MSNIDNSHKKYQFSTDPQSEVNNLNRINDIRKIYPEYISEKLVDIEFMDSVVASSYLNKYIDLEASHKLYNEDRSLKISINELDSLKLDQNQFWSKFQRDFWFIKYNNLNFIFDGFEVIPCSSIFRNDFSTFYN